MTENALQNDRCRLAIKPFDAIEIQSDYIAKRLQGGLANSWIWWLGQTTVTL